MKEKNYWPSSKYIFDSCSNTLAGRRNHWDILKFIFSENLATCNSFNFCRVMENLLKWLGHFLKKLDYHWVSWVIHYLLLSLLSSEICIQKFLPEYLTGSYIQRTYSWDIMFLRIILHKSRCLFDQNESR